MLFCYKQIAPPELFVVLLKSIPAQKCFSTKTFVQQQPQSGSLFIATSQPLSWSGPGGAALLLADCKKNPIDIKGYLTISKSQISPANRSV
ncbi:hypothetical protein FEM55_17335 [Dyadobacter sediminis]|uniref:Uncharacterized protein n=1 Tax=Dyadobacter sediminis TaxID=1493691 RepID=A0A5R9K8A9_9BACT|nr:hypothetical protein FEM55_17335 [Dyadobacter sediminis]